VGTQERGGTRRHVLLRRIRYYVYFRVVNDGALVEILAVWHASRGRRPRLD
jgi:plasmid stabilization system protein ParE